MSIPTLGEPLLGQVLSIAIECGDCGRHRWWKPKQIYRTGATAATPVRELASRLACSECIENGEEGRNLSIQAAFSTDLNRARADAYMLNSRAAPDTGSPDAWPSSRTG